MRSPILNAKANHHDRIQQQCEVSVDNLFILEFIELITQENGAPRTNIHPLILTEIIFVYFGSLPVNHVDVVTGLLEANLVGDEYQFRAAHETE
jgi:hypothetical protein